MITLEQAKELLLTEIESIVNWRVQKVEQDNLQESTQRNNEPTEKLMEFYNHVASLPCTNPLFEWYRIHIDEIRVEYTDNGVRIYRTNNDGEEHTHFLKT